MGKFITFYGINNIGKSTQAKLLVERLREAGHKTAYLKYPIYNLEPSGPIINNQLRGENGQTMTETELQTWFFLNRLEFEPKLKTLIAENDFVIAEDYTQTGIAWGAAKGAAEAWLDSLNKPLIKEDLAILMVGQRFTDAVEAGHIHEENEDLINKCDEILRKRATHEGFVIVDVVPGIEATFTKIWDLV